MKAAATATSFFRATVNGGAATGGRRGGGGGVRHLVMKSSDRAAVHGAKPPQVDLLDVCECDLQIQIQKTS